MRILKKFAILTMLAILTLTLPASVPALATGEQTQVDVYQGRTLVKSVVFVVGLNKYFVNGQTPGVDMDVAPYIDQDRTFVPVRYLGYALGVKENDVNWDNTLQKASLTLPPNTVEMTIGERRIVTNGQAKDIDVSPQLRQDRTFLPARYVAEGLGYTVKWVNEGGRDYVICWPNNEPEPDISAVKEYVNSLPAQDIQGVKPMEGTLVTSVADLEGIDPIYVRPWPRNPNIKVYKGYVKASDLPVKVDGHIVYGIELQEGKYGNYEGQPTYEGKAIIVTADTEYLDLLIIEKDGTVRERQVNTSWNTGEGKIALQYNLQDTGELSDGKPPVDLKNVKYFVVNTARNWRDGQIGLLFIENPFNG